MLINRLKRTLAFSKKVEAENTSPNTQKSPTLYGKLPNDAIPVNEDDLDKANLVTSILQGSEMHAPVLDIDFPATLVRSSSLNKYHLYLDKALTHDQYMELLAALEKAGIIEEGFYKASVARGYSAVRVPGKPKAQTLTRGGDVLAENSKLRYERVALKHKIQELESELEDTKYALDAMSNLAEVALDRCKELQDLTVKPKLVEVTTS